MSLAVWLSGGPGRSSLYDLLALCSPQITLDSSNFLPTTGKWPANATTPQARSPSTHTAGTSTQICCMTNPSEQASPTNMDLLNGMQASNREWLQRHSRGISSKHSLPNSRNIRVETLNYLQSRMGVLTGPGESFLLSLISVVCYSSY